MKKVCHSVISNGMSVYSQMDAATHLGAIFVKAGHFNNPARKDGLAHLVEHLSFFKSKKYPYEAMENIVEKHLQGWGWIDVWTDDCATNYGTSMLPYSVDLRRSLSMIADVVKYPDIEKRDLNSEIAAVLQERREVELDDPLQYIEEALHALIYPQNHPARSCAGCIPEEIRNVTLRDISNFRRRWYTPKNMGLIAFGPKHAWVERFAEETFGDWGPTSRPIPVFSEPFVYKELSEQRRKVLHISTRQHYMCVGFPVGTCHEFSAMVGTILIHLLSRRLFKRLRMDNKEFNEGVYHVTEDITQTYAHGLLTLSYASQSREFLERSEDIIREECSRLCELHWRKDGDFFDASYGALYREYREAYYTMSGELAKMVVSSACLGDENVDVLNDWRARIKKITIRAVREAAQKYLSGNFACVIGGPGYPEEPKHIITPAL